MKCLFVVLITAFLFGCNDESVGQQHRQGSQQIEIKPYTEKIPLVGDEKMKPRDWTQKSASK